MTKNLAQKPRPYTYASRGRAQHYVSNLMRAGQQSGPVYLIVAPQLRANKELWAMLFNALREALPGITFQIWPQVGRMIEKSGQDKIAWLMSHHAGAVLCGYRHHSLLRVGPVALAEATAFAAHGKPTFAFTGRRLVAWPDCQVFKIPEESRRDNWVTAYVGLPLTPQEKPFPTFTAACHMLGIRDDAVIANAAGLGPERPRPRSVRPSESSRKPAPGSGRVRSEGRSQTRTEPRLW